MHKLTALLAALAATILLAPTAQAFDCDTEDVADCVRSITRALPGRQIIPPAPRPPAVKGECDGDDDDDVKDCLSGQKLPRTGHRHDPAPCSLSGRGSGCHRHPELNPRPAAAVPAERRPPEMSEATPAPSSVAARPTRTPAFAEHVEPNGAPERCHKYFPAVGQLVDVPCRE